METPTIEKESVEKEHVRLQKRENSKWGPRWRGCRPGKQRRMGPGGTAGGEELAWVQGPCPRLGQTGGCQF